MYKWSDVSVVPAASIIKAIALMIETVRTSETWVNFYQNTRPNTAQDCHIHTHRLEKVKSQP
jgi:hypothetical protein